jgi:acetoacetyl-CoA reductase
LKAGIHGKEAVLNLRGAVAVVTGASRGLGAAIAEELGRSGAKVVVNYGGSVEPAEELASTINEIGGGAEAVAIQADVADPEQAQSLIDETINHFGRIDILINNAGKNIDKPLGQLGIEDWDEVLQLDLSAAFYVTHAALPHMTEQNSGKIINISSVVGESGNMMQANYAAAKAGMLGFTRTAALELAANNITVNAIAPGFSETEMVTELSEEIQEQFLSMIPLGRFAKPEEIAKAVRYICEDGDYMTGAVLDLNGGFYMRS